MLALPSALRDAPGRAEDAGSQLKGGQAKGVGATMGNESSFWERRLKELALISLEKCRLKGAVTAV